jgi:hypothetical protein
MVDKLSEHRPMNFVGVADARLVYVGIANRADFDKIGAPCQNIENENSHILVKNIGGFEADTVTVVFQHWLKSRTTQGR